MGDPISLREKEQKALPRAIQAAQDFVRIVRQAVGGWASTKPWLNATEVEQLQAEVHEAFSSSLRERKLASKLLDDLPDGNLRESCFECAIFVKG